MPRFPRRVLFAVILVLPTFFVVTSAFSQTVIHRARMSNMVEGITYVPNGPYSNHIAMIDGYEFRAFPAAGAGNSQIRKLFDLRSLPLLMMPRGVAWIEPWKMFVFNDPSQINKLFVTDHQGNLKKIIDITYAPDFTPAHLEGMAYLPESSTFYPDHLLLIAKIADIGDNRILVLDLNGNVVHQIVPPQLIADGWDFGGVAYDPTGSLYLTAFGGALVRLDFAGNIIAGPWEVPSDCSEGLTRTSKGLLACAGAFPGKLRFYDADAQALPQLERSFPIGYGLGRLFSMTFDTSSDRLLVNFWDWSDGALPQIASVSTSLDNHSTWLDLMPFYSQTQQVIAWLPADKLLAISRRAAPVGIMFFDAAGNQAPILPLPARPTTLAYVPGYDQFAERHAGFPTSEIHIITRSGAFVRSIDLSTVGVTNAAALAYFNPAHPSGGQFLVLDADRTANRAVVIDFNGNLLSEFNFRKTLGIVSPRGLAAITTGQLAGNFAIGDFENAEIVVFSLPK